MTQSSNEFLARLKANGADPNMIATVEAQVKAQSRGLPADRIIAASKASVRPTQCPVPPPSVARARLKPERGVMNQTEARYAGKLEADRQAGSILWWAFEALSFTLAARTTYRPDFMVMTAACEVELHEVKGFWEDDARAKIKIAASMFPFRFVAVQWVKKRWVYESFEPGAIRSGSVI
jgi:hypothetical protein